MSVDILLERLENPSKFKPKPGKRTDEGKEDKTETFKPEIVIFDNPMSLWSHWFYSSFRGGYNGVVATLEAQMKNIEGLDRDKFGISRITTVYTREFDSVSGELIYDNRNFTSEEYARIRDRWNSFNNVFRGIRPRISPGFIRSNVKHNTIESVIAVNAAANQNTSAFDMGSLMFNQLSDAYFSHRGNITEQEVVENLAKELEIHGLDFDRFSKDYNSDRTITTVKQNALLREIVGGKRSGLHFPVISCIRPDGSYNILEGQYRGGTQAGIIGNLRRNLLQKH